MTDNTAHATTSSVAAAAPEITYQNVLDPTTLPTVSLPAGFSGAGVSVGGRTSTVEGLFISCGNTTTKVPLRVGFLLEVEIVHSVTWPPTDRECVFRMLDVLTEGAGMMGPPVDKTGKPRLLVLPVAEGMGVSRLNGLLIEDAGTSPAEEMGMLDMMAGFVGRGVHGTLEGADTVSCTL